MTVILSGITSSVSNEPLRYNLSASYNGLAALSEKSICIQLDKSVIYTPFKAEQLVNALAPILCTLFGISMLSIAV